MKFAGIDVSAKELVVAFESSAGEVRELQFPNDAKGHKTLIKILTKRRGKARICIEPTGTYHLDFALMAAAEKDIEVMVANPRATRNFAKATMTRGKDDPRDARVLLDFVKRMEFKAWNPPPEEVIQLRAHTRRALQLTKQLTMEKNRLHAYKSTSHTPDAVLKDIEDTIAFLERQIASLQMAAENFVISKANLAEKYNLLLSIKGLGPVSAVRLLGELLVLPPDADVRQWVAHAGLDPRPMKSGTSVDRPTRISKAGNAFLRQILYLPAVTASRFEPAVSAFYQHLLQGRRKLPLQAQVAVMRKLLHAIHGMFRTNTTFDGTLFYSDRKTQV